MHAEKLAISFRDSPCVSLVNVVILRRRYYSPLLLVLCVLLVFKPVADQFRGIRAAPFFAPKAFPITQPSASTSVVRDR